MGRKVFDSPRLRLADSVWRERTRQASSLVQTETLVVVVLLTVGTIARETAKTKQTSGLMMAAGLKTQTGDWQVSGANEGESSFPDADAGPSPRCL